MTSSPPSHEKDAVKQLDDAFSILGGFDAVTGWAGETGVAITEGRGHLTGGIVAVPTDKAAADRLFNTLKGFIQLAGGQAGLSVTEEDYNGTHDHVVDLSASGACPARWPASRSPPSSRSPTP